VDVNTGRWQGVPTLDKPDLVTRELLNLTLEVPTNELLSVLAEQIQPNLPWADDHFEERVSGDPSNPGEEYKNWPWWRGQDDDTMKEGQFTHTYQERFWPKRAGCCSQANPHRGPVPKPRTNHGIRYQFGDLNDVLNLLWREPLTRQATFPIFFPEDTGAVHRGRIPCTLHYHFMRRNGMLHMWYAIRSCDYVRHFRDDLYLAVRLLHWVLDELKTADLTHSAIRWEDVTPGHLYFTAYSFHMHHGDAHHG
jgi:hypothetical protein